MLGLLAAAAHADSSFCSQKTMAIVAHQDDDLLFQNPDVLETIAGGGCVQTVFVTAGDAGLGSSYWHEREEGSRAAYALMAGVANTWSNSEETVAGHSLHVATLVGRPGLSEVYMRLPNGGRLGAGYQSTGYVSLPKLWRSHNPQPASLTPITQLSALDGSATYTYESLLATLKALVLDFEPDVILTQDFAEEFGQTDHGDHIVTVRFAKLADGSYPAEHVLRSYADYRTAEEPVNVFEPQLARKTQVFNAYRAHDSQICISEAECSFPDPDYNEWLKRQVVVSEKAIPGADAGPAQAVASKALVALDGSASSDPLGHSLSYEWTQTGGPAVSLSNSHAVKPTFTAPVGPATLTFSLVVKSSEASSGPDTVTVTVAALPKFTLTVSTSGNGAGTVTSSPAGISCPSDCEGSYDQGTKVTLTPAPAAGSEFKGWSGACAGTGACEVTLGSAKSVAAEFALQRHQLALTRTGAGTGAVTSTPAGISCGATCAANFDHGTLVKLTGAAGTNSKAVVWEICPGTVNASNQCEVTMSQARSATARFDLEQHTLTVTRSGSGSGTVSSSPAGISCGSECAHAFNAGTLVKLTGSPAAGSKPVVWTNCDNVNGANECEVTMNGAKTVTATFAAIPQFILTVGKGGSGIGTVTSTPAGINCGAECSHSYLEGTVVKLTGTPGANSKAVVWETCPGTVNASSQCEVTMSQARAVTARFDLEQHTLMVTKSGAGSGTVTSAPAGISCGTSCSANFDHGTEVTLSANPAAGSEFKGWSGACAGSGSCKVSMSAAKSVGAEFALVPKFALSVSTSGNGSGTVTSSPAGIECPSDCEGSYEQGTKVTLAPAAGPGSEFKGWSGACVGTGACEVTISAAKSVGAEFALQRHQLSVTKSGAGSGTVSSAPADISCGATCEASFNDGTLVKLTATPAADSKPVAWTGCDHISAADECEVMMSGVEEVIATFSLLDHNPLTVTKIGSGTGAVSSSPAGIDCGLQCTAEFLEGAMVTVTGAAGAGSEGVIWEACPGTVNASNQCEVTLSQARAVTARFDLEQHLLVVTKTGAGSATVTSSPAGINCGTDCSVSFAHGTEVTLSAAPAAGSTVAWSGCDQVVDGDRCKVSMDAAKHVAATLTPAAIPPTPTPSPGPSPLPAPDPLRPAPPTTKLLKAKVELGTATFVFAAQGSATRFRCALAPIKLKLTYKNCSSPRTYRHLSAGVYVFKVKAVGTGGADPQAITRRFRVTDAIAS
jgi:LmbE family N-acetylglucosaminyl deacetylase